MKHESPTELDGLLSRYRLSRAEQKAFWSRYWGIVDDDLPPDFLQMVIDDFFPDYALPPDPRKQK